MNWPLKDSVIGIYADGVWLAKLLMENRHMEQNNQKDDNSYTYEQVSCDDNINRFFPERYYLLPIPVDELQNNPLCENNAPW